jgi:hypothetical protein
MSLSHQPPKLAYNGLTIILGRFSRFDKQGPISGGWASSWFDQTLGKYGIARMKCDVRLSTVAAPLLQNTKCIFLLGNEALRLYRQDVSLDEQRGALFTVGAQEIIVLASYAPQEAMDMRNYESKFHGNDDNNDDSSDAEESDEVTKAHGKTPRTEYRFWLESDIRKTSKILRNGLTIPTAQFVCFPSFEEIMWFLRNTKNENLYFDLETRSDGSLTVTVFSIATDTSPIYTVPVLRYNDTYAYDKIEDIFCGLSQSFSNNTVVIHNAMFDLFVLIWRYRLPVCGKVYDTMLAMQRCFPECRKSLGHALSYFTDLPYHKNTAGTFNPHSIEQDKQLWDYNTQDVYSLRVLKQAIDKHAINIRGLSASIAQANRAVIPYLTATLTGMRVSAKARSAKMSHHDRRRNQMLHILRELVGYDLNPGSWQQVGKYLYKELGFKCPNTEAPTNEKTLMKLIAREGIEKVPTVPVIIEYRGLAKEQGMMKFKNWPSLLPELLAEPRVTCAWKLGGPITFRRGSATLLKAKGIWLNKEDAPLSFGTNIQNWAK